MIREYEKIQAAANHLRERVVEPRALVILGTGLGGLGDRLVESRAFPYDEIPEFPQSTSPGHSGHLVYGRHEGTPILVMEGRFHYYEGYSLAEVTRPIRVARALGARTVLISNAVGGLDPRLRCGESLGKRGELDRVGNRSY